MSNLSRWIEYTNGLPSPDIYIKWSWYYTVTAALQRRVWLGPAHQPCYPNMYCILVGAPGVGKGMVLKEVANFLKYWTLDLSKGNEKLLANPEHKTMLELAHAENMKHAQDVEHQGQQKGAKEMFKPLLIPVCADSITCEALIKEVGQSYRYINYADVDETGKTKIRAYGHSSLCFVLPELSSLMKKNTQNTNNFLLSIYDCPIDHEYISISRGKNRIRKGCLSIIAGTTPSFMQSTFSEDLIGEGFSSRTFYVYAAKNRKHAAWIQPLTKEQEEHKTHLLAHLKKLTTLYGNARISQETAEWIQNWWADYNENHKYRNKSPEMIPYYARKNIHLYKIAMAMHFSDNAECDENGRPRDEIPISTFEKALEFLEETEVNMHLALILEGKSPEAKGAQKIMELVHGKKQNYVDLFTSIHKLGVNRQQLDKALEFLTMTDQIKAVSVKDDVTGETTMFYEKV